RAVPEAESAVQATCRLEVKLGTCFEAEVPHAPAPSLVDQMREQVRGDALTLVGLRGSHRLDLAVLRVEPLERRTAREVRTIPVRPEGDLGPTQFLKIERVHALGRRDAVHPAQVLGQQFLDFRAGEVIDAYLHGRTL